MKLPKRLSNEQIAQLAQDYVSVFPGWSFYHDDHFTRLSRSEGPVNQNIWFGSLSGGYYRISHDITAFIPNVSMSQDSVSWVGMATQFLGEHIGGRFQSIRPSQHASKWCDIVAAMEREFEPNIRKLLDLEEITRLCASYEREGIPNDLVMMSILHAWSGEKDEARRRCIRLQSIPTPNQESTIEWDRTLKAFALALVKAIEAGGEKEFLETTSQRVGMQQ